MRVQIKQIADKPLHRVEDMPAYIWELDSFDVKFTDNIKISASFRREPAGIEVKADIALNCEIVCSRCLSCASQTVNHGFYKRYAMSQLGEYLEIDDDLREEVLLNFPMKFLCYKGCKGLCPGCGVNLNLESCRCESS